MNCLPLCFFFLAIFITGWAIYRFVQPWMNEVTDYLFMCVACLCQVIYFVLSYWLYGEYRWRLYKKAGADKKFRAIYRIFLLWITFLKLCATLVIFNILLSGDGIYNTGWISGVAATMAAITLIWLIVSYIAVKSESKLLMGCCFLYFLLSPSYIIGFWIEQYNFNQTPQSDYVSKTMGDLFTIIGVINIIMHFILIVLSITVLRNFGKGLKKLSFLDKPEVTEESSLVSGDNYHSGGSEEISSDISAHPRVEEDIESEYSIFDVIRNTYAMEKDLEESNPN